MLFRSVWTALLADQVDHRELQQVIQRHFPTASQPGLREIVYPGDNPYAIKLGYAKTDAIRVADEVLSRFGEWNNRYIDEALSKALVNKGLALDAMGQSEGAIESSRWSSAGLAPPRTRYCSSRLQWRSWTWETPC